MSFFGLGKDLNVEIAGLIADQISRISLGLQGGRVTLGGTSGSGGGTGVPPGGFVGQLIQSYVAYDTDELMSIETSPDSSALDNLNHIRAWLDPARWLRAQAQNPPDMTLYVRPGIVYFDPGTAPTVFTGGNSPTFTPPGSDAKIDVLYLNTSGSLAIEEGSSGIDPQPSYPTSGSTIPVAEVYIRASSGSLGNTDDGVAGYIYRDVRPFLNLGGTSGSDGGPSNTIDGISNPGGDIDFVAGSGMTITPDDETNRITFASSGSTPATVEIQEDDVKVADADTINFEGGGGKVTDEGGAKVTIDISAAFGPTPDYIGVPLTMIDLMRGFWDDFVGDQIDDKYWVNSGSTGALVDGVHGGIYRISLDTPLGYVHELYLGKDTAFLDADSEWLVIARAKMNYSNNMRFRLGARNDSTGHQILMLADFYNYSTWYLESWDGTEAESDSEVTMDTDWHWHTLHVYGTNGGRQADHYLDGVLINSHTSNIPTSPLEAYVYGYSALGDLRTIDLDFLAVITR